MNRSETEQSVKKFYDTLGWKEGETKQFNDAELWEDLRPAANEYVSACRRKILSLIPRTGGDRLLDADPGQLDRQVCFYRHIAF